MHFSVIENYTSVAMTVSFGNQQLRLVNLVHLIVIPNLIIMYNKIKYGILKFSNFDLRYSIGHIIQNNKPTASTRQA